MAERRSGCRWPTSGPRGTREWLRGRNWANYLRIFKTWNCGRYRDMHTELTLCSWSQDSCLAEVGIYLSVLIRSNGIVYAPRYGVASLQ